MEFSHRLRPAISNVLLAIIFTIIGVTTALTYTNFTALTELTNDRPPTLQVLSALDNILTGLKDLETVETATAPAAIQDTSSIQHRATTQKIRRQIDAIKALLAGHPSRLAGLAELDPLLVQRLAYSNQVLEARQDGKTTDELLSRGKGRELTDSIRKSITGLKEAERALIAQYDGSIYLHERNAVLTIIAGSLICIIVAVLYRLFIRRQIALRRSDQELLKKLMIAVEQSTDLIVVTDRWGAIEYVNKVVEKVTGYLPAELIGENRSLWKSGKHDDTFFTEMRDTLHAGLPFSGAVTYRAKNGALFTLEETTTPFTDENGDITHLISTGRDITIQKNLEEKLEYLSHFDVLTGIPNRMLFSDRLEQGLLKARETGKRIAVLAIDIDRFKFVNNVFGFNAGNDILRAITERLTNSVGEGDTVARIGNDEFGVSLHNIVRPPDIVPVVDRIMKNVRQPIMLGEEELVLSLAVGVSCCPDDGENAETLIRNAQIALSKAKSEGRNNYQFFTEHINKKASELMLMEKRLNTALEKDEYLVYYQPYVDMTTKRIGGAEALIKWKSDKHGLVAPSKFIPMLEDSGMIIDVGEWVLRAACKQIKEWGQESSRFPVAVNLSLLQFRQKNLITMVEQAISEFGIDASRLTLEITEGICIHDLDFTSTVLSNLKDIGISLSIDDFGTGYSSLSYLKKLPVDSVKIDMSFVKDITTDPDAASIVSAITSLARNLNFKTIAEGVETEEQWKILRLLRCDMGQGFFFSPAVPAEQFSKFVSKNR